MLAQIATRSENNAREHDVKWAPELFRRTESEASNRLSEDVFTFLQTSALAVIDYKDNLFSLKAFRKLYDASVRDYLISPQIRFLSVLCDIDNQSEKQFQFFPWWMRNQYLRASWNL